MSTTEQPPLARHPLVWIVHTVFAFFVLPVFVGPAVVSAAAGIPLVGASGSGLVLLLLGFLAGAGVGAVIGPRKRLFAPRGAKAAATTGSRKGKRKGSRR